MIDPPVPPPELQPIGPPDPGLSESPSEPPLEPPGTKPLGHLSWAGIRERLRALWKMDLSPVAVGLGVGLGVFVGCSPFIGLHTVMVFTLAALLRINPWVALLSSQISLPPLFLGIAAAEVWVGEWIRFGHASLPKVANAATFAEWLWSHALGSWLIGSLLLGGLLAVAGGVIAWLIALVVHALHRRASLSAPR